MTRLTIAVILSAAAAYGGSLFAATLNTIYSFTGPSGDNPDANPVLSSSGAILGMTYFGGASNMGAVYQLTPPATPGSAWTAETIYSFAGGSDGSNPYGALVLDSQGALYGTTLYGGAGNAGIVFQLQPPASTGGAWIENVLYSFSGGSDGANPTGGLKFDRKGSLYGTTTFGGASGNGVVFRLVPPLGAGLWTEKVLYSFAGGLDGANPGAGLFFGPRGFIYGTTYAGGAANAGTIFQLKPAPGRTWKETILHTFTGGSDGATPESGLIGDSKGALYGTTELAGTGNHGTLYQMVPPTVPGAGWTHRVLYNFSGVSGSRPYGNLAIDASGNLYGSTYYGGTANSGAVFELQPPATTSLWTETVLYSFTGGSATGGTDGGNPFAGVVFDSTNSVLYGTTFYGGSEGDGTVFMVTL